MLNGTGAPALEMTAERSQAGSRLGSLVHAALFGLALGGVFAAAWLGLERAWTEKATLVAAIVAGAGGLAAIAAAPVAKRLANRGFALRFAVAFLCLVIGTAAFASFGVFLHAVWTTAIPDDSLGHAAFFILTLVAGAVYSFLGVGAPLVLLPGLPLILLFAFLVARRPR